MRQRRTTRSPRRALRLTPTDLAELADEFALHVRRSDVRSRDRRLPPDFVDELIAQLPELLADVERCATTIAAGAGADSRRGQLAKARELARDWASTKAAQGTLIAVVQRRFLRADSDALRFVVEAVDSIDRGLRELSAEIATMSLAPAMRGRHRDPWRLALQRVLASYWLAQGVIPPRSESGLFVAVNERILALRRDLPDHDQRPGSGPTTGEIADATTWARAAIRMEAERKALIKLLAALDQA